MIVSQHAAERFRERVAPHLTLDQARAEINSHATAIETAIEFGAPTVILGCGARLCITADTVTTVLPSPKSEREWVKRHVGSIR